MICSCSVSGFQTATQQLDERDADTRTVLMEPSQKSLASTQYGLDWFYGISAFVGYFMPNPLYK